MKVKILRRDENQSYTGKNLNEDERSTLMYKFIIKIKSHQLEENLLIMSKFHHQDEN